MLSLIFLTTYLVRDAYANKTVLYQGRPCRCVSSAVSEKMALHVLLQIAIFSAWPVMPDRAVAVIITDGYMGNDYTSEQGMCRAENRGELTGP